MAISCASKQKSFDQSLILPLFPLRCLAAASASICVGAKGASPSILGRKAVLQLLKEHPIAENSPSLNEKDLHVGRGTRAFLYGTGSRRRASLYVRGLHEGSIQKASGLDHKGMSQGAGLFMHRALICGSSRFKLPCESLSQKFCPVRFGVFAL